MKLGVGARAVSMGEAYTAVADDASALYWNPAALTRVERRSATFMHAAYLDSSFFDYGAYAHNLGDKGVFGASFQYFSAGKIMETDATGTDVGDFTPHDLALTWGYARSWRDFSFGLGAKFIRSTILDSAQTGAVDLGALSPGYLGERLRVGLAVSNLGGQIKFDQEKEDLPLLIKLGGSYRLIERWIASLDLGLPRDNDPFVAVGSEYLLPIRDELALAGRVGFNSRTIGDVDGFTGVSFGVGLALSKLSVDYGFLPFGSIGQAHRVSLSYRF
ncbi:MAG: PorV/PorQ family protein [Elusimicrobia bacterium]|nr:PorV/PorQ family protein [Elusimicrobiota bacterium]